MKLYRIHACVVRGRLLATRSVFAQCLMATNLDENLDTQMAGETKILNDIWVQFYILATSAIMYWREKGTAWIFPQQLLPNCPPSHTITVVQVGSFTGKIITTCLPRHVKTRKNLGRGRHICSHLYSYGDFLPPHFNIFVFRFEN